MARKVTVGLIQASTPFDPSWDVARVKKAADSSKAVFRGHPAKVLLGVVGGILEGEILRSDDKLKYALKAFEKAVKAEDKIDYDEPEPLPFSARHWLGAALLDLERPQDAERVYREDLKKHPHNGWSLFGLKQALLAQGKPTAEVDQDLASSWARADVVLTSSRY